MTRRASACISARLRRFTAYPVDPYSYPYYSPYYYPPVYESTYIAPCFGIGSGSGEFHGSRGIVCGRGFRTGHGLVRKGSVSRDAGNSQS